jgi:hypothetical protein
MGRKPLKKARPALSESLQVFGFGSFFVGASRPKDIDLVLVHRSASRQSCELAIGCKRLLKEAFPTADVVLLSEQEALGNSFIIRAGAVALGRICVDRLDQHVQAIIRAISSFPDK